MRVSVVLIMFCIAFQVFAKGDVESGAAKVAACASCHGNDGNSMVPVWPKLAGIGEKYIFQQLLLIKNKERVIVEMTGLLDASTEQDLWDMAAYYNKQGRSLSGAEEIKLVNVSDPSEALAMGERVYRAGNLKSGVAACTGCHAPSGSGNGPAGYLALGGQLRGGITQGQSPGKIDYAVSINEPRGLSAFRLEKGQLAAEASSLVSGSL